MPAGTTPVREGEASTETVVLYARISGADQKEAKEAKKATVA